MEGWRGSSGYCTKKSSAEKSKSLWKQWLRAKEANAKVSSNWIFFFFFVRLLFSKLANPLPQPAWRQRCQTFQQRALAPLRVGETVWKMAPSLSPRKHSPEPPRPKHLFLSQQICRPTQSVSRWPVFRGPGCCQIKQFLTRPQITPKAV